MHSYKGLCMHFQNMQSFTSRHQSLDRKRGSQRKGQRPIVLLAGVHMEAMNIQTATTPEPCHITTPAHYHICVDRQR